MSTVAGSGARVEPVSTKACKTRRASPYYATTCEIVNLGDAAARELFLTIRGKKENRSLHQKLLRDQRDSFCRVVGFNRGENGTPFASVASSHFGSARRIA
jgi:hypothetical protein